MLARREYEEPFNKSPVIRAVSALLLVIFTLASLTRVLTRLSALGHMKRDDILIISATVFAIIQSIMVILQGANHFGQPMESLSTSQVDGILKRQYASDMFCILAQTLAKLSASRTISDLAPATRSPYIWATEGVVGVWGLSSILITCFQCDITAPWDYISGQCLNRAAIWTYIDSLNMATDIALTAILAELIKGLQVKAPWKIMVLGLFSCRLLNIPPITCHIILFRTAATSTDPTFDMWKSVIVTQVIQCISMIATCTPFLKPVMDALDSGGWVMGDLRQTKASASRSGTGGTLGYPYGRRKTGKSKRGVPYSGHLQREHYNVLEVGKNGALLTSRKYNEGLTTATATAGDKPPSWDWGSQTSQTVLVQSSWTLEAESYESTKQAT